MSAPGTQGSILIVEDELLQALAMEQELLSASVSVVMALNADELRSVRVDHLSAAVVNLRLWPGVRGQDIIRELRSYVSDLSIVVVTGYQPESEQADLRGLGGPTERLIKLQHLDFLVPIVERLIRERGSSHRKTSRRRRGD
jgi:DNA-binding NtrC family response regulator